MNLRTHLKMAALALVVACGLWAGVHNEDRITLSLEVPITYEHPPDIVRLESLDRARVTVRTSRGRGKTLTTADVTLRVENQQGRLGRVTEVLSPRQADATFGVEVVDIQPARFAVIYDRRVTARLPVQLRVQGEPADGYRVDLANARVEPARVRVQGPESLLAELDGIATEAVSVEGADAPLRIDSLELALPTGPVQLADVDVVTASVPVVPRLGQKTFEEVPIAVLRGEWETTPPNPASLEVTIEGPMPALRRLPVSAINLTIDVRGLEPKRGDYRVPVERSVDASVCPGCIVFGVAPQREVDVRVFRTRRPEPDPTPHGPAASDEEATAGVPPSAAPAVTDSEGEPAGRTG